VPGAITARPRVWNRSPCLRIHPRLRGRDRSVGLRELDWDPEVDDSAIGVTAKDGVVTLTGFIDSYAGKLAAERVVKRVRGVRAVANDVIVRLKVDVTDTDIAAATVLALKIRPGIPPNVQATVHNGHVTLTGHVEWLHQKEQAEVTIRHIAGVRGVVNHIDVAPRTGQRDVRRRIMQSLHHTADLDGRHIDVAVTGDVVTLTGTVGSWSQYEAAERGAGSAPGIRQVDNQIRVVPQEPHEFEPPDEIC
jgi:osmotically-inducible protein OsmY